MGLRGDLAVPYEDLLAEYRERVSALTHENVMLRASVVVLQRRLEPAPQGAEPGAAASDAASGSGA